MVIDGDFDDIVDDDNDDEVLYFLSFCSSFLSLLNLHIYDDDDDKNPKTNKNKNYCIQYCTFS